MRLLLRDTTETLQEVTRLLARLDLAHQAVSRSVEQSVIRVDSAAISKPVDLALGSTPRDLATTISRLDAARESVSLLESTDSRHGGRLRILFERYESAIASSFTDGVKEAFSAMQTEALSIQRAAKHGQLLVGLLKWGGAVMTAVSVSAAGAQYSASVRDAEQRREAGHYRPRPMVEAGSCSEDDWQERGAGIDRKDEGVSCHVWTIATWSADVRYEVSARETLDTVTLRRLRVSGRGPDGIQLEVAHEVTDEVPQVAKGPNGLVLTGSVCDAAEDSLIRVIVWTTGGDPSALDVRAVPSTIRLPCPPR